MANPAFSERAFEFAFNSEYCADPSRLVIGLPHIPSQNEEQWLGYDVAFELGSRTGQTYCLALQHKVSSYAASSAGKNSQFWGLMDCKPYFRFPLDVPQFNLLQSLSALRLPGIEYRYCAPAFHTWESLKEHHLAKAVVGNSAFIDISDATPLSLDEPHNIIYRPSKPDAFVLSEPQPARWSLGPPEFGGEPLVESTVERTFAIAAAAVLQSLKRDGTSRKKLQEWNALRARFIGAAELDEKRFETKLAILGVVLGHYFDVTLIARRAP